MEIGEVLTEKTGSACLRLASMPLLDVAPHTGFKLGLGSRRFLGCRVLDDGVICCILGSVVLLGTIWEL